MGTDPIFRVLGRVQVLGTKVQLREHELGERLLRRGRQLRRSRKGLFQQLAHGRQV